MGAERIEENNYYVIDLPKDEAAKRKLDVELSQAMFGLDNLGKEVDVKSKEASSLRYKIDILQRLLADGFVDPQNFSLELEKQDGFFYADEFYKSFDEIRKNILE